MRESIRQDLQYAVRAAGKSPGFFAAATAILALGIGANTAMFSIVSGVLLRPLPYAEPDRLVQIYQTDARFGSVPGAVFTRDLQDWRDHGSSLLETSTYGYIGKNLLDASEPERLQTVRSDRRLFHMLGAEPLIGRTYRDDDPDTVVVLSAGLWKRRFGGDPACVGRKILLDQQPYTIIGVMPESFQFPYRASLTELWIPWDVPLGGRRNARVDFVAARLRPGVTLEAARAELTAMAKRAELQFPDTNRGRGVVVQSMTDVVTGGVRSALLTLFGAVGLVLFIACANVANLMLARASRRSHEMAVRAALGAGRGRLIQQLLTESILLSIVGSAGGLLLASAGVRAGVSLAAAKIPRAWEIGLDWRVFFFLLAASIATGIAFGLLPAVAASRVSPQEALRHSGGGRSVGSSSSGWNGRWLRDGLVVSEIALSFVLLVSACVVLRAFLRLQSTPTGLTTDHVLTMRLTAALSDYRAPGSFGRYVQQIEDRVRQTPGVRSAGFIQYLPLQNWGWSAAFRIEGRAPQPGPPPQSELRYVSPGYFEALHIPIRKGRAFTTRDTADAPRVIVVNEALARTYFPGEDPVGRVTDRGTIIGVAGDVRTSRMDLPASPEVYYSFAQNPAATSDAGISLVVRTIPGPETMAPAVREAIRQVNAHQVVYDIKTMDRVVATSLADMNLYAWLIGVFSVLAVLLATSGVYGVVAYSVAARTQEFGLRIALGAESGQILRLVLGYGAAAVAGGLIVGVAGTVVSGRLLESLLHGAAPADAITLAVVGALLAAAAIGACVAPARRAMRVDPNVVLKYE
jgi:putative ABC transport system permease protein